MKIKQIHISEMLNCLHTLSDGKTRVLENQGGATGQARESLNLPTMTKMAVVRNLTILKSKQEQHVSNLKSLIQTLSPDGTPQALEKDKDLTKEFHIQNGILLEEEVEVEGLLRLQWDILDKAGVEPTVMAGLRHMVFGMPPVKAEDLIEQPA